MQGTASQQGSTVVSNWTYNEYDRIGIPMSPVVALFESCLREDEGAKKLKDESLIDSED
jgi:hypothetical protein